MILLDKPLVSDFLKQSIRNGEFQALDTGNVLAPGELDLISGQDVIDKMRSDPSTNLHTISENALKWVYDNLSFTGLPDKLSLFKDKLVFRELLRDMYPDLFFQKVSVSEINSLNIDTLPMPFIIKPAVGFFSMGVHKVFGADDWPEVKHKIRNEINKISAIYPDEVLSLDTYIIEACIEGREFAFDAYFDDDGKAHVLGVMEHPFSGESDVSDRVYNTSTAIVRDNLKQFDSFLEELGKRACLKNFSLHTEVRIDENGRLIPIEVNPLRFGAWCTSADLAHHAFGFNPYSYYINKKVPDWEEILSGADDSIYSIVILDNSSGIPASDIRSFDYDGVISHFSEVLEIRKIDYQKYPIFGILFTRTHPQNYTEIEEILHDDLMEYVKL